MNLKSRMPSVEPIHTAERAGGFSDRFLGIASSQECLDVMRYGVTRFGIQGIFEINHDRRIAEIPEQPETSKNITARDHAAGRTTIITLNEPLGNAAMRKIIRMGCASLGTRDNDLIASLMMVQAWQHHRADENECHLPLKFVAYDKDTPAGFAALSIYANDQPAARQTHILCVVDMMTVDNAKADAGFDLDLSIVCANCWFDVLCQIYRLIPDGRSVHTAIRSDEESLTGQKFADFVCNRASHAWNCCREDARLKENGILLEELVMDNGWLDGCLCDDDALSFC